jgi:porphobilinogen synthase
MIPITQRPRRNRKNRFIRQAIQETILTPSNLIQPLFIHDGDKEEITSLPGQSRLNLDLVLKEVEKSLENNIFGIALFPKIDESSKDSMGSYSLKQDGIIPHSVFEIKKRYPEINIITDVALDPYSSDGHDGIVSDGEIINDDSVEQLTKMALVQAQAGADWIAPSDMMDGRIGSIRSVLDQHNLTHTGIISYSVKYASSFYGPFRDALGSAPKAGDKKSYQMDFHNKQEALREALLDINEGADILMVKPALAYLDIIQLLKDNTNHPISAYQVSGEYAMIMAAVQNGWLNKEEVVLESLTAIKRAGASLIFTYFANEISQQIR